MEERAHRRRIWAENAAIFFLGAFALFLFCVSFFPSLAAAQRVQASLEMGRMVERAFSVALFFLATRLYRRLPGGLHGGHGRLCAAPAPGADGRPCRCGPWRWM